MSLTAPIFLAALGLLVPVLIAFLVRRRRNIVRVPSTMVWRLGARSVAKNRRIRDVRRLLALLACLAGVAALVVASARPSGSRRDATVYVLDVSASMSDGPLDDARTWLTRDIAAKGPNASVAIVLAGAEPRIALPPSPPGPEVEQKIRAIVAEADIAAIDEAVTLAEGLATGTHARVIVLTDHPVESEVSRRTFGAEQRVFSRKAPDNVGITSFFTRTPPDARDEEEREASVTVATSSSVSRRAHLVIRLGDRVVADRKLELNEHGEATERVLIRGAGKLVARVTPADGKKDALSLDDEASLAEIARRPPRVAFVHETGEHMDAAAYFIEKALRAAGVKELTDVHPDGPPPSNAEIAVVLRDGKGCPTDVPSFLIGVQPKEVIEAARPVDRSATHLRSMALEDPLLRGVSLDDLTTLRAQVLTPPRGAHTLVELDGGPVLVAGGVGARSWVWLGIEPEASDLVLRVAFPVLVGNVLTHLGGASQVVIAKTAPRSEVMLESSPIGKTLANAAEPRWRLPLAPAATLAALGAILLALEAWLTFRRRWAT